MKLEHEICIVDPNWQNSKNLALVIKCESSLQPASNTQASSQRNRGFQEDIRMCVGNSLGSWAFKRVKIKSIEVKGIKRQQTKRFEEVRLNKNKITKFWNLQH